MYSNSTSSNTAINDNTSIIVLDCVTGESYSSDPFGSNAEDFAAEETRKKEELFAWADTASRLSGAELELELERATKRFGESKGFLRQLVKARINEKRKHDEAGKQKADSAPDQDARHYGPDFKSTDNGVFIRQLNEDGKCYWEKICTTRIDIEAVTRDQNSENWGAHVVVTDRDGVQKKRAVPYALIGADRINDISALLCSLGVGVVPTKKARQSIVTFLTTDVPARITSVPQIGWHESQGKWLFVLPAETLAPSGFEGARPVLQSATLETQNGLHVSGTVEEWIAQIASPLAGNSNIHLCVGTAFAGPLLLWAHEPPGFFHIHGTSKIAKSLAAAVGQSVWGRPKIPGQADAFGASWTATAVGLERYAVLRSDLSGSFDEIGEGEAKVIRAAVYVLANGSTKLRGNANITLRPMESFRILGISTGEPSLTTFLSAGGERVPAGLTVRLVDVPAEVQPESAFETCPVNDIAELGKRFYPLTAQLHGAVGRAWLEHLVELGPDEIQRQLNSNREAWLALPHVAAAVQNATGQVRSVINRFGLVAAALRMAIEAGLLPWSVEDTDIGVAACMVRWAVGRKGRLDLAGEMVNAVEQIRAILTANLDTRFVRVQLNAEGDLEYANLSDENRRDTLGFIKDGMILVESSAWHGTLCAGFDAQKTARYLRDEKLLVADPNKLQLQNKVLRAGVVQKSRFYTLHMRILEDAAGTGTRETAQ